MSEAWSGEERLLVSVEGQVQADVWVRAEFGAAVLGDGRLNHRLISIVESFCAKPEASIPKAMNTWDKIKGAYRFLNNVKVTHQNIMEPHRLQTQSRITKERVVLAVQDTTTLDYSHHPETEDLGNICTSQRLKGMLVHTTLCFTPERVPLGIIHQHTWVRPLEEYGKKKDRRKRRIDEKESQKWLNSLDATERVQSESPGVLLINVGDREADIYELFRVAIEKDYSCRLLVRAAQNRLVEESERRLWTFLESLPIAATLEVEIPRRGKTRARRANLELRYGSVTLLPPQHRDNPELLPIRLCAVYVHEPSPPDGIEPLCWRLLTTLEVESVEDAILCVDYYAVRYSIELFHKVLKSGCKIEERQLETAEALRRCLALDSVVAWRIMFMTMIGRTAPDVPCTVIFENDEWKALYCFIHKVKKPPTEPLRLGEATRMLARLGGFIGRKSDGHPGASAIWCGMQRLKDITMAWNIFSSYT